MAKIEKQKDKSKKKKVIIGTLCGIAAAALIAGVTIPCVMCHSEPGPGPEPVETVRVSFSNGGDETINISRKSIDVVPGTTFGEIKAKVDARKIVGEGDNAKEWQFLHWYKDGAVDPKQEPFGENETINEAITLHPYFEEPQPGEIIVRFVAAKGDEEGVDISQPTVTIEPGKGQTFYDIRQQVTASKILDGKHWDFQWWYRDGFSPLSEVSDTAIIEETLTVHPYFTPPAEEKKCVITLKVGGEPEPDPDVEIFVEGSKISSGRQLEIDQSETFLSFKNLYQLNATKKVNGIDWQLGGWTTKLPPEQSFVEPVLIGDDYLIKDDMTIYPYFIEPVETWNEKTIKWDSETGDKNVLVPGNKRESFDISNFVLTKDGQEDDTPVILSDKEEVVIKSLEIDKTQTDPIFNETELKYSQPMVTGDRVGVTLEADKFPATSEYEDKKLVFDITFAFKFDSVEQTPSVKIEGIALNFKKPLQDKGILYSNGSSDVEVFTAKNTSGVLIDSVDRAEKHSGYFHVQENCELTNDEILSVDVLDARDSSGQTISKDLEADLETVVSNGMQYINLSIAYKKVESIFEVHETKFKLVFHVTRTSTGDVKDYPITNTFCLRYEPNRDIYPYNMLLKETYVGDSTTQQIDMVAQIENKSFKYFETTDYLAVTNLTRTDPSIEGYDPDNPVYFTNPMEANNPFNPYYEDGKSDPVALKGTGDNLVNLWAYFGFNREQAPTIRTNFPTTFKFEFWDFDPYGSRVNTEKPITEITMTINFVYEPVSTDDYTIEDWAKLRSLAIVQSATNNTTNEVETSYGTGWITSNSDLHKENAFEFHMVTSWDVRHDYDIFEGSNYSKHVFKVAPYIFAKQYNVDVNQKYLIIDDDHTHIYNEDNNDFLELSVEKDLPDRRKGLWWVDQDEFKWDKKSWGDYVAPNMAVATICFNNYDPTDNNIALNRRITTIWTDMLYKWADLEKGVMPYYGPQSQQLTPVIGTNISFSSDDYGLAFTGGFNTTTINLHRGGTAKALYWKSINIPIGDWGLIRLGRTGYAGGCEDAYWELWDDVYHLCPAYTMLGRSFDEDDYFDEAGTGAMFVLCPYADAKKEALGIPRVAGINWNGGSGWNWFGRFTPYFDCFIDGNESLIDDYLHLESYIPTKF